MGRFSSQVCSGGGLLGGPVLVVRQVAIKCCNSFFIFFIFNLVLISKNVLALDKMFVKPCAYQESVGDDLKPVGNLSSEMYLHINVP